MNLVELLDPSFGVSNPPPGSVNVRLGDSIAGAGGTWIPCATRSGRSFFAGLFQVGPGQRQVCVMGSPFKSEDDAFTKAVELATSAAG